MNCCRRLFAQLSFSVADRAEFHIMQFIKLPSTSDRLSKSSSKNVKRDSILPLDLLKGTDSDVKCYLANCLHSVHVTISVHLSVESVVFNETLCLQSFNAVGWMAGRASGL